MVLPSIPPVRSLDPSETEFCDRALGAVSRTFALSIRGLPVGLREAVRAAYLLCRIVDTIEDDDALAPGARTALFAAFDRAIERATAGDETAGQEMEARAIALGLGRDAEAELAGRSATVFRAFALLPSSARCAIAPRLLEMSAGMRAYSSRAEAEGGLRIRDLPDLERYCHHVAGTVGELLTDLFADACPVDPAVRRELDARAAAFGIGLQLVNILKDIAEDAARGACFLPLSCARDHAVSVEHLLEPRERARGLALCRSLVRRAREHLDRAEEYALLWPHEGAGKDARAFSAGPLALALGTLRLIEIGEATLVPGTAPAVSREFVLGVFTELGRQGDPSDRRAADRSLRALLDRARIGVAGPPSRPPEPPPHVRARPADVAAPHAPHAPRTGARGRDATFASLP